MLWSIVILFSLLILVIIWVLLIPIVIVCDSTTNSFGVYQKGTFSVRVFVGEKIESRMRIFGFKPKQGKKDKIRVKKKKKKRKSWSPNRPRKLMQRCLKSLTLKDLIVDIDTGDVILNAKLVPAAYLINNMTHNALVNINFEGRLQFVLRMELRLYIILLALIKDLIKR